MSVLKYIKEYSSITLTNEEGQSWKLSDDDREELLKLVGDAEKYRWHDLRKNPDDLPVPDSGMEYIGVIVKVDNVREPFSVYYDCGEFTDVYDFVVDNVVAWRYIEPFAEG